jgi:hypothetical protein
MERIKSYTEFINESESIEFHNPINEGEVNFRSDKYAIIFLGGSIGQRNSYPIFCKGQMGSVYETGNDKESLKETAARLRKQLSPGEKKYYGMSYTVIEMTPYKIKEIEYLISKQQETANESIED